MFARIVLKYAIKSYAPNRKERKNVIRQVKNKQKAFQRSLQNKQYKTIQSSSGSTKKKKKEKKIFIRIAETFAIHGLSALKQCSVRVGKFLARIKPEDKDSLRGQQ